MSEKELRRKRKKKRKKTKKHKAISGRMPMLLLGICAMVLVLGGHYVYAKYLKESVQKGTAIASAVWFTSSHAFSVSENADSDDMSGVMKTQAKSSDADGRNYDFTVEIRNYKNILVFNKSSEKIPYTIAFKLSDTPGAGDSYQVTPVFVDRAEDGTITESAGNTKSLSEDWTEFTHTQGLPGGEALEDTFKISINAVSDAPVSIYVMAKTADGAIVSETLKGEIELVKGSGEGEALRSAGFVTGSDSTEDAEQVSAMLGQAAFTYRIVTGSAEQSVDELVVYWDPEVYTIDRFSNAYLMWSEDYSDEAPEAEWSGAHDGPGEIAVAGIPVEDAANAWYREWSENAHYITMPANSYASISIGFFRGEKFDLVNMDSMEQFHKYIHIEKG